MPERPPDSSSDRDTLSEKQFTALTSPGLIDTGNFRFRLIARVGKRLREHLDITILKIHEIKKSHS